MFSALQYFFLHYESRMFLYWQLLVYLISTKTRELRKGELRQEIPEWNLILKRKAERNFHGNILENHFTRLKLLLKFKIFDRANLSGFVTWEFTTKEDLGSQNKYFYLT